MPAMEPLAFARMLNSLQEGIPAPGGKETAYAYAVVGQAVKAFNEVGATKQTAQAVRLITQPLLEDLREAQARVKEKSAALDKTANVLDIVAGQLQLTAFEYESASPGPVAA